jgi:hypothetical protein
MHPPLAAASKANRTGILNASLRRPFFVQVAYQAKEPSLIPMPCTEKDLPHKAIGPSEQPFQAVVSLTDRPLRLWDQLPVYCDEITAIKMRKVPDFEPGISA